jgi:Lon-like protease
VRLLRRLFLPVSLALLVWAAAVVPLPVVLETPGSAVSLDAMVHVETADAVGIRGDFLITVVRQRSGTVFGLLRAAADPDTDVLSQRRVIPPGVHPAEHFARQRALFDETAQVAAAVALRAAGYPMDPDAFTGQGARILDVVVAAPADGKLQAGDVVVSVDGAVVRTAADLRKHVVRTGAGNPMVVGFHRDGAERSETVVPGRLPGVNPPAIGVLAETDLPPIVLPVPVTVTAGRIGGPSAGLLVGLTVFDKATADVDLAAGRTIGGTGTLEPDGRVGVVGGVRRKVVVAHRRALDMFLVPTAQLDEAAGALPVGSTLQLLPVGTFEETLTVLGAVGDSAGILRDLPWSAPGG